MMSPAMLVGLVIAVGMVWLVFWLVSQTAEQRPLGRRERAELNGLRSLVDDLKQTAWDHRELDSALATIIIDKIREHERRSRELGA